MATRRSNRKLVWWGAGILVATIILIVALVVKNNLKNETRRETQTQVETKKVEETEEKTEKMETPAEEVANQKEDVKQYDGESPNTTETLTGVISYAGVSGSDLIIRVNIDQYLASGSCKLALLKDGTIIYNSTAEIESSVSTSTCDGFKISTAELKSGELTIEITLEADNKSGKITGVVTI